MCSPLLATRRLPPARHSPFTNLGFLERNGSDLEDHSFANSGLEIVNSNYGRGVRFIFKGLMLPIFCFEFAWRSAVASWRCSLHHMRCMQARMQRSNQFHYLASLIYIHSEASVEHNAWELKQYIEELYWGSGKRVMLLGHSKGGVDAAAALSIYSQELRDKVAGLALVQSPYGGTPIASDILHEDQVADKETRRIMEFLICKLIKIFGIFS